MNPKSLVDYNHSADPSQLNMDTGRLEKVREIFYDQIDHQALHSAAQLVVLRHGQVALDLAHGKSRFNREVTPDTPFFTFSVTKAFTGVCVHQLIEQGKIEMDAPIAEYWPEFGQKEKKRPQFDMRFSIKRAFPLPTSTGKSCAGRFGTGSPGSWPRHLPSIPLAKRLPITWSTTVSSWARSSAGSPGCPLIATWMSISFSRWG